MQPLKVRTFSYFSFKSKISRFYKIYSYTFLKYIFIIFTFLPKCYNHDKKGQT
nr:MAG TPA: hypothetical protein [Caudoviricetes sp.]